MKIRHDKLFDDLSTEIIERLATGDATVEDLHAARKPPNCHSREITLRHLLASLIIWGGTAV